MKKLILILLLIILAVNVSAYSELQEYKDRCYDDGSFQFYVENTKTDEINLNEVELYAYHAYKRFGFYPNGTWSRESILSNTSDSDSQRAVFTSYSKEIPEEGDYIFAVRYFGCRNPPCKISFDIENCPAYSYNCQNYRILTESCHQDGNMMYIRFNAENPKQFRNVNPYSQLMYYVDSNQRDLWGVDSIDGVILEDLTEGLYQISFPIQGEEVISKVAINHRNCDSPRLQMDAIECGKKPVPVVEEPKPVVVKEPEPQPVVEEVVVEEEPEVPKKQPVEEVVEEEPIAEEFEEEVDEGLVDKPVIEDKEEEGIPKHFVILILIVIVGVFAIIASYVSGGKKQPPKKEKKSPPSFGFGEK